jgi:glycosyltransferase involved in cell wall biosynthesis
MKISVAVRTKFHAFQLAQQLHERGMLHQLYTSFYGSFLNKDNSKGFTIPKKQVKTNLFTAFLFYQLQTENLAAFRFFGHWVANQLKDEQAIVTFPMITLPIIERAKKLQIKTILTQASAHDKVHYSLLKEAYQQAKLPTTTIDTSFTPERIAQTSAEYQEADYIQVASQFVANTFIAQGISEKKLLYVPLGVDLQIFYQSQQPQKQAAKGVHFVYAGQLSVRKGIVGLLYAFTQLALPHAWLHLVGNVEPAVKPFLAAASKQVLCYGAVPQTVLREKLEAAHVFIINSVEDGFAQVVPQAMACGLPIICTSNVGGADLVADNETGFVIPINSPEKLQEKMVYFYENPDEILRMGNNAKEKVRQYYTWQHYGERLMTTYQKILS